MDSVRLSGSIVSKEGFLYKKGGIIKSWSRRYFVLSPQSLCYFRSETHEKLEPLGRIFLSDIVDISTESTEKKKAFVFVLTTKKRAVLLQGANNEDRHKWVEAIKRAAEHDKEAESKDPFRKSLRRLTPGTYVSMCEYKLSYHFWLSELSITCDADTHINSKSICTYHMDQYNLILQPPLCMLIYQYHYVCIQCRRKCSCFIHHTN